MKTDRALVETTLIALEQYVTTLIFVATHSGWTQGISALDAARTNLIDKVEAFVTEANKR